VEKKYSARLAQLRLSIEDGAALVAASLVSVICVRNRWFDEICMMLRRDEKYQLDEYVGTAFVLLAVAVIMFVRREWQLRARLRVLGEREQGAHEAARRDHLTGLANRLALTERLNDIDGRNVLFLLIDLDGFKAINDLHGHAAGDAVLKAVSQRLQSFSREAPGRFVARLGGDEFGCLVDCSAEGEAFLVQQKIVRVLEEPVQLASVEVRVGASIGSVASTEGGLNPDELLQFADMAMYRDKVSKAVARRSMKACASSESEGGKMPATADMRRYQVVEMLRDGLAMSFPLSHSEDLEGLLAHLDVVGTTTVASPQNPLTANVRPSPNRSSFV
jgi:diguanylate cyclase (GGDEF)-like protein